jgi:hypothetical protein
MTHPNTHITIATASPVTQPVSLEDTMNTNTMNTKTMNTNTMNTNPNNNNHPGVESAMQPAVSARRARRTEERGEGIISVALAVLIMAGLAALMWVAYDRMWRDASAKTESQIGRIAP